jgi:hypothetical protein
MFLNSVDSDFLARHERYKDLLREAEHKRLIQTARLQRVGNRVAHRKVTGWLSIQMVKWGSKLHLL